MKKNNESRPHRSPRAVKSIQQDNGSSYEKRSTARKPDTGERPVGRRKDKTEFSDSKPFKKISKDTTPRRSFAKKREEGDFQDKPKRSFTGKPRTYVDKPGFTTKKTSSSNRYAPQRDKPEFSKEGESEKRFKPKFSGGDTNKREYKPKFSGSDSTKREYKPKVSGDESKRREYKPNVAGEESRKNRYKPKSSADEASKREYKPKPYRQESSEKRYKAKSGDETGKPAYRPKSDRQESPEKRFKPKFSGDESTKREYKPRFSTEGDRKREKPAFNPENKSRSYNSRPESTNEGPDKRKSRGVKSFDTNFKKPFSKQASTEERSQKRTDRDGYYADKKKTIKTPEAQQNPEPGLKKRNPFKKEKAESEEGLMRLNRYISNAGVCSRRDADTLIESGEIKVNGKVVTEMGYQVEKNDIVKYGNRVLNKEKLVYVLLNKPKDYITTTEDPDERKTVMDLVKNACEQRIYPVGRLDRNTTGLLLLTNDGELAAKLAHPSNNIKKVYQVELDKPITQEHFQQILDGVQLEDGLVKIDDLAIVTPDQATLGIEIHIGKNRIVRRVFEHLGYEVIKLDRVIYAGLTKKELPRGNWRILSEKEVIKLKYFI